MKVLMIKKSSWIIIGRRGENLRGILSHYIPLAPNFIRVILTILAIVSLGITRDAKTVNRDFPYRHCRAGGRAPDPFGCLWVPDSGVNPVSP